MTSWLGTAAAHWAGWMWGMTWQAALLVAVLGVASRLLRNRAANLRYVLWLLLFVKLAASPSLSAPWSAGNLLARVPLDVVVRDKAADAVPAVTAPEPAAVAHAHLAAEPPAAVPASARDSLLRHWKVAAMSVWAGVAGLLVALLTWQAWRYRRRILRRMKPAPEAIRRVFTRQQEAQGVRRGTVWMCGEMTTPGVFGAIHPKVLLPLEWQQEFNEDELACVLAHEIAHIRRGDIFLGWLTTMLACLYWFHPGVWLAHLYLRREREMACDDAALMATGKDGREYAGTILRVAEGFAEKVPAGAGLLGLMEMSDNLLYRIRNAGDMARSRRIRWGWVLVAGLMVLLLPMAAPPSVAEPTSESAEPVPAVALTAPVVIPVVVPDAVPVLPAEAPGVALLDIAATGAPAEMGDATSTLRELLLERLANAHNVRLVERARVDEAAKELSLGQSGLVRAETAGALGRLVGARILVAGRLMHEPSQWVMTARLIDAETSEIAAIRAEASEAAGLPALAETAGTILAERLSSFGGRNEPAADGVETQITALRESLTGRALPRVVVSIPECHAGRWAPDTACENEVIRVLTQVGFTVMDVGSFITRQPSSWWLDIFHGQAEGRDGVEIGVRQGWRSTGDILHDARLEKIRQNADVLVIGEAFSEQAGEQLGFKSCRGRMALKALDTATEQVAAAVDADAAAADTAELIAGKAAVRKAGTTAALELARQLAAYWSSRQTGKAS